MSRLFRALIPPLLIVALLYALFGGKGSILSEEQTFNVSYSEAMRKVETGKISAAEIYPNDTATLTAKTGGVASEIISEGIELTSPSPIVRIPYVWSACEASMLPAVIPITSPPTKLMSVMMSPSTASPLDVLRGTVHGTEECRFFLDLFTSFLGFLVCDGAGVKIGIDSHLLTGHSVECEAGRYLGYTLGTFVDYDKLYQNDDDEDYRTNDYVVSSDEAAELSDDLSGVAAHEDESC